MSSVSQNPSPASASEYEPRYQVGDLIRDGLEAVCEITSIHRASMSDGYSDVDAIRKGFATYEYRRLSDGYRSVSATRFLHEMIDTGYRSWAYLGPVSMAASDAAASDAR